jgi:hypothetical protein
MLAVGSCAAVWQYPVKADLVRLSDATACCLWQLAEISKSGNELPSRGQEALIFGVKHATVLEQRVQCARQTHNFHRGKCHFKYLSIFRNSVEEIQVSLKSDKKNRVSSCKPVYMYVHISPSYS